MLEFTGLGTVLRTLGVLYWALAGVLLVLALSKPRTRRRKAAWTIAVVAVFGFLPAKLAIEQYRRDVYAKEAWAYFRKKCETEAGEKIYKTFTGVKSVLVVKPLPPATERDLYDQFWYGDPYTASATSERAEAAARRLTLSSRQHGGPISRGLDFVELADGLQGEFVRIPRALSNDELVAKVLVKAHTSRFGVSWEDISQPEDRKHWVAGSRFRVIDLTDNSIVAERIGYFIEAGFGSTAGGRRPWLTSRGPNTTCPPVIGDYTDQQFISKVFPQREEG